MYNFHAGYDLFYAHQFGKTKIRSSKILLAATVHTYECNYYVTQLMNCGIFIQYVVCVSLFVQAASPL